MYNNLEYVSQNLKDITTVIDDADFEEFPQKVANLIKLQQKERTPKKAPRIIIYHHPARSEMTQFIESAAHYYDLPVVSVEKTLLEQREKLLNLGCVAHEVLTRRAQVPDDV